MVLPVREERTQMAESGPHPNYLPLLLIHLPVWSHLGDARHGPSRVPVRHDLQEQGTSSLAPFGLAEPQFPPFVLVS